RGLFGALQARLAPVHRSRPGARRRPAAAADERARAHPPLDHRRLGAVPLNAEQRRDLLEIVDDRYDRGSLLITSQLPVNRWHEVIGDPTLADAILDLIIHRAHRIDLKGPSLRRRVIASDSSAARTPVRPIAHGGPQRLPARAAPSLVRALRAARGSPPWTPWTILCPLDRHHPFYATCIRVDGAARCDPHADPVGRVTA